MARLIDADKLQEVLQEAMKEYDGYSPYDRLALSGLIVADDLIDDAPTVEEVVIPVRCRDCKNYTNMDVSNGNRLDFHWCGKFRNIMSEDGFCSYGERRCK